MNNNCWVAYCDLLGFTDRIRDFETQCQKRWPEGESLNVFFDHYYKFLTGGLQQQAGCYPSDVSVTWFSDTFVFFTRDDSWGAFVHLHGKFDRFCVDVISGWPFRAAIGFGRLYADVSHNIFLGSGLIDAYTYAEKQNWIGLVVTPEACKRVSELGFDLSRLKSAFTKYPVPVKRQQKGNDGTPESKFRSFWNRVMLWRRPRWNESQGEELFAARIHHQHPDFKDAVETMQREAMNCEGYDRYKEKYENTLRFFQACP